MVDENYDDLKDDVAKRLLKTELVFVGELGLEANGHLTEDSVYRLFDSLTLGGYKLARS